MLLALFASGLTVIDQFVYSLCLTALRFVRFGAVADKISVTVTLRREFKPMSQSGYCFRFAYSNGNVNNINLFIRRVSISWNSLYCDVVDKFTIIYISVRLRRSKAISWLA